MINKYRIKKSSLAKTMISLSSIFLFVSCERRVDNTNNNSTIKESNVNSNDDNTNKEEYFDDFTSDTINRDKWLLAYKNWGGNKDGKCYNGGVSPENVKIENGCCNLYAHGNNYEGLPLGINKDKSIREDGKRVGACIATREYFSSASFEIKAKIAPEFGVCSAMWTMEYEEYYPEDEQYKKFFPDGNGPSYYVVNHEIDIEMPGRWQSSHKNIDFNYALCNTWVGEKGSEYTTKYTNIGKKQNDGNFHKYRFDWHTGDEKEEKRVDFYFDDVLTMSTNTNIPTNAGRLWIGVWFPNGWTGTPDFSTSLMSVDYVKIKEFHEKGDTEQHETYPKDGWASDTVF